VRRCARAGRERARRALEETTRFPGVIGPISFDERHDAVKPGVVIEIRGNAPRYVTDVEP
jgi:branched-chain amino acid transport system substrate-binding protein